MEPTGRSCSTCRHLVSMGHGRMGDRPTWIRHCDVCVNFEAQKEPDPQLASEVCRYYEAKMMIVARLEEPKPPELWAGGDVVKVTGAKSFGGKEEEIMPRMYRTKEAELKDKAEQEAQKNGDPEQQGRAHPKAGRSVRQPKTRGGSEGNED